MAEIRINHITKRFGDFVALHELDLTIRDGEFLVLLGPSGCGKTTTLRSVAGLERQTSGDIYIGDTLVNDLPPGDRDIAMVFQFYALYPHLSAYDNIAFPLRAQKTPANEVDKRVRAVAQVLRIEHLVRRRPKQLSGGEQQRVALGRAMVRRPRAFLMDEPLTNLDFKLRVEMRSELKRIHSELNTTLFYVTNDQTEAMSLADRIAVLNAGVLQQVGTPEEVYDHPLNRFVAGFIGNIRMNFLQCVLRNDDPPALNGRNGAWQLPIDTHLRDTIRSRTDREALVLGVRPEDLTLTYQPVEGAIEAEVYVVEPLGDRTIYDLRVGDDILKVRTPPTFDAAPGSRLWFNPDRSRIHLFDPRTDLAII